MLKLFTLSELPPELPPYKDCDGSSSSILGQAMKQIVGYLLGGADAGFCTGAGVALLICSSSSRAMRE